MPVETFNYIDSLNASNPPTSDGLVQGDDHIRGIKTTLKNTFPNINGAVNATDEQLNQLATGFINVTDGSFSSPALGFGGTGGGLYRTGSKIGVSNGYRFYGDGSCPTGMIADFLNTSIPTGWYELNGQAVPRTGATADLFAFFGTVWGVGDGSTTFNLPNLNDRFRRSRGSLSFAGQLVADQIKTHNVDVNVTGGNHNHGVNFNDPGHAHIVPGGAPSGIGGTGQAASASSPGLQWNAAQTTDTRTTGISVSLNNSGNLTFFAAGVYNGAAETTPMYVSVVTCVKA